MGISTYIYHIHVCFYRAILPFFQSQNSSCGGLAKSFGLGMKQVSVYRCHPDMPLFVSAAFCAETNQPCLIGNNPTLLCYAVIWSTCAPVFQSDLILLSWIIRSIQDIYWICTVSLHFFTNVQLPHFSRTN